MGLRTARILLGSCSQKTETSSLASDCSSITYYTLYCKSKFPHFPNFLFHSNTSFFKKTKKTYLLPRDWYSHLIHLPSCHNLTVFFPLPQIQQQLPSPPLTMCTQGEDRWGAVLKKKSVTYPPGRWESLEPEQLGEAADGQDILEQREVSFCVANITIVSPGYFGKNK